MQPVLDFSDLRTPAGQGDTLVLPSAGQLPDLAEANRRLLKDNEFRVLDVSSLDCRCIARQRFYADLANKLWIVTGHQPEFIHAGVWAKHVVTQRLAERLGGVAANIIVDHDVAKAVALVVPTQERDHLKTARVAFAPYRPGVPWELLEPLRPRQLDEFADKVRTCYGARYNNSLMGIYFAGAADVSDPHDWVDQTVAGRRAIDAMFGVRMIEARAHDVWGGPLLAQMLLDAERFVSCYNEALREYRRMLHIKGSFHPIPDLVRQGDRLELPIWAVRRGYPRQRVFIARGAERLEVFAERDSIGTLAVADLQRWETAREVLSQGVSAGIRPRALTLTLWSRLFLADVFIHGIGGAKYDRITDLLVRKYFEIEPPGIACVSATLRLELPARSVSRQDLHDLERRMRDIRYNPQRYLPRLPAVESLLATKADLLARSRWLRENQPDARFARHDVFQQIHQVNERMLSLEPEVLSHLGQQRQQLIEAIAQNNVARNREYFIGLFRRQDLQFLCDMLPTFA